MTADPAASDDDAPRHRLERAIADINGLARVLMGLNTTQADVDSDAVGYLGDRLAEHHAMARDAFDELFKLGDYGRSAG